MDKNDFRLIAANEAASRFIRHSPVPIIDFEPIRSPKKVVVPQGSVTTYIGRKGSPLIERLKKSNIETDENLQGEIHKQYEGRKPYSYDRLWRILNAAPVFADLRYGGRNLATNICIPEGIEVVCVASPYNGGDLFPKELTLVEHYKEGMTDKLEAVAFRHSPPLTPAELAAVKNVPIDQLEINLAPNASCGDDWTAFVVAVIVATVLCGDLPDLHIAEESIKAMSPTATAIQLMQIRREALSREM